MFVSFYKNHVKFNRNLLKIRQIFKQCELSTISSCSNICKNIDEFKTNCHTDRQLQIS